MVPYTRVICLLRAVIAFIILMGVIYVAFIHWHKTNQGSSECINFPYTISKNAL